MATDRKNRHHQVAQRFLERGQRKRAIAEFEKALAQDPADIRTRLRIAELYLREGNADRAVGTFIQCARHYEELGSVNKALTVYEQVLEILPDRVELYVAMADLEIKTGAKDAAMGRYRTALRVLDDLGDPGGKLDVIRCILNLEPGNLRERVQLAEGFIAAKREDEGVDIYRQVLEWLEQEADEKLGVDLKSFQLIAERYLFHRPEDAQIAKKLALNYVQLDQAARALPKLRSAYRETPHDLELLGVIAQAFDQLGQSHKSVAVYKEMARLFERAGLETEKERCYRSILRLNPTDQSIRERLGDLESTETGQLIQFESGPKKRPPQPTATPSEAPSPESVFGPPPGPDQQVANLLEAFDDDDVDIGFEDEIEHTVVDPSFIPSDLLHALDKSPALKVTSGQEGVDSQPKGVLSPAELQELDFYVNSGLNDDAKALLSELQTLHGDHPALIQRRRQLDDS